MSFKDHAGAKRWWCLNRCMHISPKRNKSLHRVVPSARGKITCFLPVRVSYKLYPASQKNTLYMLHTFDGSTFDMKLDKY